MSLAKAPEPAVERVPSPVPRQRPRRGLFLLHSQPDPHWRPRRTRARRMLGPAMFVGAGIATGLMLHTVDPREPGHYPTCPFLAVTGLYCPGCGAMRAIASLTDGDVPAAFGYNPFAMVALVLLIGIFVEWAARQWTGRQKLTTARPWVIAVFAVLTALFWVARNLPGMTWLSPA